MVRRLELLSVLADGAFHSGESLANELGVSRAAIWKHVQGLAEWGLDVFAVRGRGYCLSRPLQLLDPNAILLALPKSIVDSVSRLEVFPVIESTNGHLMGVARSHADKGRICMAERQTDGRGRRGRTWISPFGCNLYVSVLWRFLQSPSAMSGLPLAMGVAIATALEIAGAKNVGLKWPNDIYSEERKLGGILVEMFGEAGGPSTVVVGFGININMSSVPGLPVINQPWTDFATAASVVAPCRNSLAASILGEVFTAFHIYEQFGLSPFLSRWDSLDVFKGRDVQVHLPQATVSGIAKGVDVDGALRVEVGGEPMRFLAGEVSLRLAGT